MCSPARCRQCGKVTWTGCGMHVDQVMAGVPADQQCVCSATASPAPDTARRRGLFRR